MPQILVVADGPQDAETAVVYSERISPDDLESDHFSGQLIERVGWALGDARLLEDRRAREEVAGVRRINPQVPSARSRA